MSTSIPEPGDFYVLARIGTVRRTSRRTVVRLSSNKWTFRSGALHPRPVAPQVPAWQPPPMWRPPSGQPESTLERHRREPTSAPPKKEAQAKAHMSEAQLAELLRAIKPFTGEEFAKLSHRRTRFVVRDWLSRMRVEPFRQLPASAAQFTSVVPSNGIWPGSARTTLDCRTARETFNIGHQVVPNVPVVR